MGMKISDEAWSVEVWNVEMSAAGLDRDPQPRRGPEDPAGGAKTPAV
jgi:hypothetical protein